LVANHYLFGLRLDDQEVGVGLDSSSMS